MTLDVFEGDVGLKSSKNSNNLHFDVDLGEEVATWNDALKFPGGGQAQQEALAVTVQPEALQAIPGHVEGL
jgi:hypothetical protein